MMSGLLICWLKVGWQLKRLVEAMKEDAIEVVLTLKKCPKHSTNFARVRTISFQVFIENPFDP